MHFVIDEKFLTSVCIKRRYSYYEGKDELTEDEMIKVLKGLDIVSTTSSDDHPEFKKLRNMLESIGLIRTQRSWWNGDVVQKEFTLNGVKMLPGDSFVSAAAMASHLATKRKYTGV